MIKKCAFALFLMFTLASHAQNFKVVKGDTINRTDSKGVRQGVWKKFYEDGMLMSEGAFHQGVPAGKFTSYYKNRKLMAVREYGNEGRSRMVSYYENGNLKSQGNYIGELKDSTWNYYNEIKVLISVENYKKGIKDGKWTTFYDNGKTVQEAQWKSGKKEGLQREFYKDGKLKSETNAVSDQLHGPTIVYDPEGKAWIRGAYHRGLQDGTWQYFDDQGRIEKTEIYKRGSLIKSSSAKKDK